MAIFDEANKATEEMFANNEQPIEEDVQAQEEQAETVETPAEQTQAQPTQEDAVLGDAVNTAEVAAQVAQEKESQLQQALREIEILRAQSQEMQGTISELSRQNEEKILEEAMQPPVLDINGLAFATEEEVARAQAEYAQKMTE